MQNTQDHQTTRLVSRSGAFLFDQDISMRGVSMRGISIRGISLKGTRGTAPMVSQAQVMHADTLSAFESALLLGSFLTLAASLASLAAL